MYNADTIKQHIVDNYEDGVLLQINVADKGYTVGDAAVESVTMYVSTVDDGDGYYIDGDLAVNWKSVALTEDADTAVMQRFYWEHGFDEQLRGILCAAGFSEEAAADVCGSEWGMQDEERASYDAGEIANEVRAALM